jgi:thiosulfate dehydrogenase
MNPARVSCIFTETTFPKKWGEEVRNFLVGVILGVIALPLMAFFYLRSGRAPVAASEPPLPFEKLLARTALHARIEKEMPSVTPISGDEANMAGGVRIYREHCAFCHGLPGQPPSAASKGMFPKPPQLFDHMVTDDPPGETYWKVANGIRLTGMPGFKNDLSTGQMWQVSLLLANADKLSPASRALLKQ